LDLNELKSGPQPAHKDREPNGVKVVRAKEIYTMLNWAIAFFLIAILAAVLGFGGVAFAAAGIAKLLFVVFLVLFLVSLVAHVARRA
jgi:uncharacterized membrane protein YtjA (UPF0391 family)